jgi:membrane protease YdiL (CAAX protease family)
MKSKQPFIFLIIAFLWSWIFWFIGLNYLKNGIDQESINKFITVFFIGVYGPTISAIITTFIKTGYVGLIKLLKKIFIFKAPLIIYISLIFLPLIFVSIGVGLYQQFIGPIGEFNLAAYTSIPLVLWSGLYAGPLGEELGWRGYLLPNLQEKFSAYKSATIIGFIWFCWHIPLFWAPFGTLVSGGEITFLPVITYFVMILCISYIITWMVNRSNGSVFIAILFHLSLNAGIALLFYPEIAPQYRAVHLLSAVPMIIFTIYLVFGNKLKNSN